MDEPKKPKLNYFDYNKIVSFSFGSTTIAYRIYDLRKENWNHFGYDLTACLYQYNSFSGDYELISIGWDARIEAAHNRGIRVFYVDNLFNIVEYLFSIEPNINKPLQQAKDRLYQRAFVQYFQSLIMKIVDYYRLVPSKNRYLMTYPSHWTLEKVAYLRSLLQIAGIVDEHDHPDRLIMYNEGEAILRFLQSPIENFPNIREGQKYMICDLSESKVDMHIYDIKGSIDPRGLIKSASRYNWYNGSIKEPAQIYIRKGSYYPETMLYLASLFSTPSFNMTTKDLEDGLNKSGSAFNYWWIVNKLENLVEDDVKRDTSISYNIPHSLQDLYHERLKNIEEPTTEPLPQWIEDGYIDLSPRDFKEKVLKPVCNRIIHYIKKIIEIVTNAIDDIIIVDRVNDTYLMKLIADEYKETTKRKMYQIDASGITISAILKYLDNKSRSDIYKPKIVHDDLILSAEQGIVNTQDIIILIDYGLDITRVSYIHAQPGQIASDANVQHIMNWPGQSVLNRDFPTLSVMLIPEYPLHIGKDLKIDLFGNLLTQNRGKAMFILQENDDYSQEISNLADTKFYTFEKDEYGIFLVTHRRKRKRKIVKKLRIVTTATNSTSSYKVTRKRISFQEFSLLYFEYLTDFLHTYIYSKTGTKKDKHRYCITHENQGYPEQFTLSHKDIRQIALKSKLISADIPTSLLVLKRAEAAAIYCRKVINTTITNEEAHLYFLQVQLHPDRCLLVLNAVPLLDHEDINSYKENGKSWECVHKYAKTENIFINFMDVISEKLWIQMQKIGSLLLRKCQQHQAQKKFFNSKNMQMIKNMFYGYISSTKDLNLEDGEKEHKIRMCDKDPGSCCYLVATSMDLIEFAFNPAINQLVSTIQSSIFNQNLFEEIQISDIFVMGELLNCQDDVSYKCLEECLLTKLRNTHFPRFDNFILQSKSRKTQVRKLNGREYQQGQDGGIKDRHDSLAKISLGGSITFSIDPRNLLVERLAAWTYVIQFGRSPTTKIFEDRPSRTLKYGKSYHIIILKGTPLNSLSLIEDTISKHFMITKSDGDSFPHIDLFVKEDINVSYFTNCIRPYLYWLYKFKKIESSNFEMLNRFSIFNHNPDDLSYPVSFKFRHRQTERYEFWFEKGKNSKDVCVHIQEPILLKSCHNE